MEKAAPNVHKDTPMRKLVIDMNQLAWEYGVDWPPGH
jgi:hypothetical protein